MSHHRHITKYNVDLNKYATITCFGECALYAKYYKGLAPRIKGGLGRPNTLAELRARAINLDLRCWERKDDKKYKNPIKLSQYSAKIPSRSSSTTSYDSIPSHSHSSHTSSSRASTPAALRSLTPKPKKPDLSKVLGPDGELFPEGKNEERSKGSASPAHTRTIWLTNAQRARSDARQGCYPQSSIRGRRTSFRR
jgi:hypothetical protein